VGTKFRGVPRFGGVLMSFQVWGEPGGFGGVPTGRGCSGLGECPWGCPDLGGVPVGAQVWGGSCKLWFAKFWGVPVGAQGWGGSLWVPGSRGAPWVPKFGGGLRRLWVLRFGGVPMGCGCQV